MKSKLPPPTIIQRGKTERELTKEEVSLVRNFCCKEGSEEEFALFLWICRKHRVDPLMKQIHAIFFNVTKHHIELQPGAGGGMIEVWKPGKQMVIVMGINGYRSLAARQHKDYGSCGKPQYIWSDNKTPAGRRIPSECTMTFHKRGMDQPIETTLFWDEFAPADLNDERAKFWSTKPAHMLAKCVESHNLRKGYPDLADIYTTEEMSQAIMNYSPEGREIFIDGKRPDGTAGPQLQRELRKQAKSEILDAKLESNWCEKHKCPWDKCPADEHTKEENDAHFAARATVAAAKNVTPKEEPKRARPRGPEVKEQIVGKRERPPRGVTLSGVLHNTYAAMTKDKRKYLTVKISEQYYKCYRPSIYAALEKGPGNVIEFLCEAGSITGLIRIGKDYYEADGKTRVQA